MTFNEACDHLESGIHLHLAPTAATNRTSSTEDGARINAAKAIWSAAGPIAGTPAELYLAKRAIPLDALAPQPNLRFARLTFDGSTSKHPALIAAVRDVAGDIIGIQRTYLTEAGEKISKDAKRSLGRIQGGAIRLNAGLPSDWHKVIYVCEGLEDGLSILIIDADAPVWVAAGGGMMPSMVLPDDCGQVRIAADNDIPGERALRLAGSKFSREGREVMALRLDGEFKDYNEYLQWCEMQDDTDTDSNEGEVDRAA